MKFRKILLVLGIIFVVVGVWVEVWKPDFRFRGNDMGMGNETKILNQVQNDTISYAKVKEVVDGDTVKLESGETVRYIGVDAPEIWEYDNKTGRWKKTERCYGEKAKKKNEELALGKLVKLERDVSKTDKYERSLYYVWEGETFINLELVKGGYAAVLTIAPDLKYERQILAAEKEARENGRGLWKGCNLKLK